MREVQVILTLYLGTLMGGFSVGFSSSAIPGMKEEWNARNTSGGIFIQLGIRIVSKEHERSNISNTKKNMRDLSA